MRHFWLNKKENKELIVFLNGWGMDEKVIQHLKTEDIDVLDLFDYREFDFKKIDFHNYEKKYLICWSMGVYVSSLFYEIFKNFDKKIAIAGTTKIIDDDYGIKKKIYDLTIRKLNPEAFLENMKCHIEFSRSKEELKEELISIKNLKIEKEMEFDGAIIPLEDVIVPYKNQVNFWEKQKNCEIIKINSAHFVFNCYNSWRELLCQIKN